MPFADIDTIWEYYQLIDKARKTKPYKTSSSDEPKYPLGNRRYSDRYFKPVIQQDSSANWAFHRPPIEIYYSDRCKLGTFHPDDTFEFDPTFEGYGQGDTGVLSSVLPGWVSSKSQYGGLFFYHRQTKSTVPVFRGLRIRLCDGTPVQNYEIHTKSLNRRLTKPYREKHDPMFKLALTMLKAMGTENMVKEIQEMLKGQVAPAYNYKHYDLLSSFGPDDPAGAVMWLGLRYNTSDCRYDHSLNTWSYRKYLNSMQPEVFVRNVRNYFYKELYVAAIKNGEEIVQTKVYKFGDQIPTVEWGSEILVDGVARKRLI